MAHKIGFILAGVIRAQIFANSHWVLMSQRLSPNFFLINFSLSQDSNRLLPKLLLHKQIKNLVEFEPTFVRQNVFCFQEVKDLLLGADLNQIIKVELSRIRMRNRPLFDHIERVKLPTSGNLLSDWHIGGVVTEIAFLGEVKMETQPLGTVWR